MIATRVFFAMLAAVAARAAIVPLISTEQLHADIHGAASFLEVLGGIYSIVIAFVIYVVWEQYNRVQTGLAQEAAALEDLCRVSASLSAPGAASAIRGAALRYIESTAGDEPRRLAANEPTALADEHFSGLCQSVRSTQVVTEKDAVLFEELLRCLARVSDRRDERLSVSATRIPRTLWGLVLFATCALIGGFLILGIRSFALSAAVVAALAGCLTFLLSVVWDMDNPFTGVWNVSYQPMRSMAARIGLR